MRGSGAKPIKPPFARYSLNVAILPSHGPFIFSTSLLLALQYRSDFLIEEFQSGTEYSAEGVFVEAQPQVITLTTKHLMEEADCFIERGHVIPALLPEPVSRRARQVVEAALRALGLVYGVFHVEFWIDGDRIVLGEVHVRPGGDYIHLMVELVTGLELYGLVYDQLLGRVPDPSGWRIQGGAAILYFTPPAGRVLSIGDAAAVLRDPACVRLELPLAAPLIMAGVRTGAVTVVATATLAGFVGGGGLGVFLYNGFAQQGQEQQLIGGAIVVAVLAILTEVGFGRLERLVTPRTASRGKVLSTAPAPSSRAVTAA